MNYKAATLTKYGAKVEIRKAKLKLNLRLLKVDL